MRVWWCWLVWGGGAGELAEGEGASDADKAGPVSCVRPFQRLADMEGLVERGRVNERGRLPSSSQWEWGHDRDPERPDG